jgi:hypothetical protein
LSRTDSSDEFSNAYSRTRVRKEVFKRLSLSGVKKKGRAGLRPQAQSHKVFVLTQSRFDFQLRASDFPCAFHEVRMMAKACAGLLLLSAVWAGSALAAPCYSDGDVVTLEGKATRQATHETDASAQAAWVLALSSPVCVMSAGTGQGGRQQSTVSAVQIIDATPSENARIQVTGKLVTGNVSAYYAVPTAIWVLKQRVLSAQ